MCNKEDRAWVPREKYDMIMEKLDAAVLENQRLTEENRQLKKACATSKYEDGIPLGNGSMVYRRC
jgi:hypothetical protein